MFWLSGIAGTGKSIIARTIAQLFASCGQLGASFSLRKVKVSVATPRGSLLLLLSI
jgi:sigma54-dependent transcription regulator